MDTTFKFLVLLSLRAGSVVLATQCSWGTQGAQTRCSRFSDILMPFDVLFFLNTKRRGYLAISKLFVGVWNTWKSSQLGMCYAHLGGLVETLEGTRWVIRNCGQKTGTITQTCGGPAFLETFNNRCCIIFYWKFSEEYLPATQSISITLSRQMVLEIT